MRIGVMAAGAVGGYFGARLAAAGHEVHFIARGAQLEAIRRNGLKVESPLGDLHLKDAKATDDPKQVGTVDVVLFAVKLWDTERAAELARPMIGPDTRLITLQNGVDSVERIAPILGADKVLGGTAHIATVVAEPGVIRHTSQFARLRAGRIDGKPDVMLARFVEAGQAAGIDVAASAEINADRWKKFVFLAALAGATGATRQPLGAILADADTRALFVALMREVIALAAAKGVALPQNFLDEQIKFAENAPKSMKASLLHDLERGNRLELDWLTGAVTRLGRELKVPTPMSDAIYAVLKLHRMGARTYGSRDQSN
ncbi:MAG TPA: 2-dehydropantoate 2-reductase [Xanthobacteraceae bacterium]|nr:2-dehydropantoate 2-reductase [Xanthobacteraceae bacterium]